MIHDYSQRVAPPEGAETWTTEELQRDFDVHGFMAPYVVVTRKTDGARGSLEFVHNPRVYFGFEPGSAAERRAATNVGPEDYKPG